MQLHHAIEHHAKDKVEIVNAVAIAFATILNPAGWQIGNRRRKGGPRSFFMYHPDSTKRFYFGDGGKGIVLVRDAIIYKDAHRISLRSKGDVFVWAKRVAKGKV